MIRPSIAVLAAAMMGTHIGDAIPRVELPVVRKGKGIPKPRHYTGKSKGQGGPNSAKIRRWKKARRRIQQESRRRNRGTR